MLGKFNKKKKEEEKKLKETLEHIKRTNEYLKEEIDTLKSFFKELEENIKAFLDLECKIGEEIVNNFGIIIYKMLEIENRLNNKPTNNKVKSIVISDPLLCESPFNQNKKDYPQKYIMQSFVNRKQFLTFQKCISKENMSGKGKINLQPFPIEILYYEGKICSIEMKTPTPKGSLELYGKYLEEIKIKEWEKETEDNLIAILSTLIHNKISYLEGVDKVLSKLTKEQLIQKLKQHTTPLLKKDKEKGLYKGEALFHYLLFKWPSDGKEYLLFYFIEENIENPPKEKIFIGPLIKRAERFLKLNFKKGK